MVRNTKSHISSKARCCSRIRPRHLRECERQIMRWCNVLRLLATSMLVALVANTTVSLDEPRYRPADQDPYQEFSPIELLLSLRPTEQLALLESRVLNRAPKGWIVPNDAIRLFRYVEEDTPCRFAYWSMSSLHPESGASTIGIEARRMIQAFCDGNYPPNAIVPKSTDELKACVLSEVERSIDANIRKRP